MGSAFLCRRESRLRLGTLSPNEQFIRLTMERIQRIKELYRELNEIHDKMKPFLTPQNVGEHREWTQEDADQHLRLHQRQGEIIKELADLERGHI